MAGLNITEREIDDVVVFDLNGDITFGDGSQTLRREIRRVLGESKKKICLNLEKVHYVDSSGIGELISSLTAIRREDGGELILLNPTERIETLLEISSLTKIFDIRRDKNQSFHS